METTLSPLAPFAVPWTRALRLTFTYEGEKVDILSQQSIDMIVPAPATAPPQQGQSGCWSELRDANDRPLYSAVLHNPIRSIVEDYSKETQAINPKEVIHPKGCFVLLV